MDLKRHGSSLGAVLGKRVPPISMYSTCLRHAFSQPAHGGMRGRAPGGVWGGGDVTSRFLSSLLPRLRALSCHPPLQAGSNAGIARTGAAPAAIEMRCSGSRLGRCLVGVLEMLRLDSDLQRANDHTQGMVTPALSQLERR